MPSGVSQKRFQCIYACSFRELVDAIEQWKATSEEAEEEQPGASQETSQPKLMRAEHLTEEPHVGSDIRTPSISSKYAWQTDDAIQVKRRKIYGDYARRVSGNNCAWRADVWCEKASRKQIRNPRSCRQKAYRPCAIQTCSSVHRIQNPCTHSSRVLAQAKLAAVSTAMQV